MPMYLNQASVYDLQVQTTVCELGCKKYNGYLFLTVQQQLYKHLCQFCVSHIHVEGNWKRQHLYPVIPIKQNKKRPITYIQIKFSFT